MTALDLLDNLDDSAGPVCLKSDATQVLFGAGTSKRLGELARELNGRRVLLVTDKALVDAFPKIHLISIDDPLFGGWKTAQPKHFGDGGIFDQVYTPAG